MKLSSIIFRFIIAAALMFIIAYVAGKSLGYLFNTNKDLGITDIKWWLSFLAFYFLLIKPMVAYWGDIIFNLLGLTKDLKDNEKGEGI